MRRHGVHDGVAVPPREGFDAVAQQFTVERDLKGGMVVPEVEGRVKLTLPRREGGEHVGSAVVTGADVFVGHSSTAKSA